MNSMPDRVFVDTNILVYAHDVSAGIKHDTAKNLIQDLWENKTGCLSIQVMQEFYFSVTQKVPTPMDHLTATGVILDLRYWKVHEPKINDVVSAVDIQEHYADTLMVLRNPGEYEKRWKVTDILIIQWAGEALSLDMLMIVFKMP